MKPTAGLPKGVPEQFILRIGLHRVSRPTFGGSRDLREELLGGSFGVFLYGRPIASKETRGHVGSGPFSRRIRGAVFGVLVKRVQLHLKLDRVLTTMKSQCNEHETLSSPGAFKR